MKFSHGKRDNYITAPRVIGVAAYAQSASEHFGTHLPYSARILADDITVVNKPTKNIVLVIDESVTAHYLGVNGYPVDSTPFLGKHKDLYFNLGLASSASNASNTANYILRNGLTPSNWPESALETFSWPSLFTYAKRAGMRTIMLDSQQGATSLQNYMSNHDLKDIDDFINLPRDSGLIYAMDFEAIDKLKTMLEESDKPCFVVLVKMGIHFPYYLRYPDDKAIFKPDYDKSSAMVEVVQYKGTSEGAQRQLNTYLNSIVYCVDYYLEYLSQQFDLDNTMVIYTSDHGQSINSQKTPASHNTWPAVVPEQFSVPLILLGSDFKKYFTAPQQDQYSAFQIFPSLLALMGYPDGVVSKYGPTLFEEGIKQQSWLGPLFGPDGRLKPVNTGEADISLPGEQFARGWKSR